MASGVDAEGMYDLPKHSEQLVNFRVAVKQRLFGDHLGKDAANAPHVNWAGVTLCA